MVPTGYLSITIDNIRRLLLLQVLSLSQSPTLFLLLATLQSLPPLLADRRVHQPLLLLLHHHLQLSLLPPLCLLIVVLALA